MTRQIIDTKLRSQYLPWSLVLLFVLLMAVRYWSEGPGLDAGDHAHLLLHARALAEGQSYNDIAYIYTPYNWVLGPPAQPPGLPVTLAPVIALFGSAEAPPRVVMLLFSLVFVLVAGQYFARHHDRYLGLGVALMVGLSWGILHASTQVGSDLPFAALIWIVIALVDKPGDWRLGRILLIAAVGGLAMSYRVVGGALVPALIVYGLLRYREHRLRPLAPLAVWGALLVLAFLVLPMAADIVRRVSFNPIQGLASNSWAMVKVKLYSYRLPIVGSHLYPFPSNALNDAYHAVSLLVAAIGLIAWMRQAASRFVVVFFVVYMLVLFLVPVQSARYLWPVFPVFVFGLLHGIKLILRQLRGSWLAARAAPATLAMAVVLSLLTVTIGAKEPPRRDLAEQPDVVDLFAWLREKSAEDEMRVVFFKPRVLAWETRIPAMAYFVVPGIEKETEPGCVPSRTLYLDHLREKRISHVVEGDLGLLPREQRVLVTLVQACADNFELLFSNPSFRVYRFLPGGDAAGL